VQHPRPFRFGLMAESVRSRNDLIRTARAAEAVGYDVLLIRDHWQEEPFGHQLAPLTALAVAAEATTRLRVGSMVFSNDYRHPVVLAKEAATLDLLSGGRFELGLGAGFHRTEYEAAGLAFDRPGVRVDRLEESVRLLKGLFGEEPYTFHGEHFRVADLDLFPKPVQRPHPPLLVAGSGRRMLSLAGREADIVGVQTVSTASGSLGSEPDERLAARVAQKIAWIREAAGDRFDRMELNTFATFVFAEDRETAARRYAAEQGWEDLPLELILDMPAVFLGTVEEIVADIIARRERFGFSYFVVSDTDLERAAPIVGRLAGR
jgi:probable F420-dependent oxidoreductase